MTLKKINENLDFSCKQKPMILNITNIVTINAVANVQLLIGASPIMSNHLKDALGLVLSASAVNINLGTADKTQCKIALKVAKKAYLKKPINLDLVGYGNNSSRNNFYKPLLKYASVIKGNGAEIISLYNQKNLTHGVDSNLNINNENKDFLKLLAQKYDSIIVMTGKTDYVADNKSIYELKNGHLLQQMICGTGCILSGIITVFLAHEVSIENVISAISFFNISAQINVKPNTDIISFWNNLVYNLQFFKKISSQKDIDVTKKS